MKKLYLVVVCLLIAGLLLGGFGCAKKAPPAPTPTPTPAPAPAPAWSPTETITWIVQYTPGGGYDTYSRGIAPYMTKYLGVEVIIKNIPGTGGARGATSLYRAKPDGYTIGILDVGAMTCQELVLEREFELKKFTWLGQCDVARYIIAVAADSPFYTLEDLKKAAAVKPLRLTVAGVPSSALLVALTAFRAMDVPFVHVPGYGGSAECIIGVMRGDAEMDCHPISTFLPFIESGDLRPIFQFPSKRSKFLPDTPTVVELGYPELADLTGDIRVIAAPPNLPKEIVDVLEEALMKSLQDPGFLAWSEKAKRPIIVANADETKVAVTNMYDSFMKQREVMKEFLKLE